MCSAWLRTAPLKLVHRQEPIRSWCNRIYGGEIEVFRGRGSPAPGSSPHRERRRGRRGPSPMSIVAYVTVNSVRWPKEPRERVQAQQARDHHGTAQPWRLKIANSGAVAVQDRAAITQFRRSRQAVGLSAESTSESS